MYNPKMKAYHYERSTKIGWIQKAIKNGYGRFELEKFHPDIKHKHEHGVGVNSLLRLGFGFIGYLKAFVRGGKEKK